MFDYDAVDLVCASEAASVPIGRRRCGRLPKRARTHADPRRSSGVSTGAANRRFRIHMIRFSSRSTASPVGYHGLPHGARRAVQCWSALLRTNPTGPVTVLLRPCHRSAVDDSRHGRGATEIAGLPVPVRVTFPLKFSRRHLRQSARLHGVPPRPCSRSCGDVRMSRSDDIHHCRGAAIRNHVAVPASRSSSRDLHGEAGSPGAEILLIDDLYSVHPVLLRHVVRRAGHTPQPGEKTRTISRARISAGRIHAIFPRCSSCSSCESLHQPRIFELDVVADERHGDEDSKHARARGGEGTSNRGQRPGYARPHAYFSRGCTRRCCARISTCFPASSYCASIRRYHPQARGPGIPPPPVPGRAGASRGREGLSVVNPVRSNGGQCRPTCANSCPALRGAEIVSLRICSIRIRELEDL